MPKNPSGSRELATRHVCKLLFLLLLRLALVRVCPPPPLVALSAPPPPAPPAVCRSNCEHSCHTTAVSLWPLRALGLLAVAFCNSFSWHAFFGPLSSGQRADRGALI
eukprot:scaffold10914_cov149-Isochrysis_galbana.AAC.1